jgi:ABC-type transport system involved in cytochrome c biogenesis permease subunit
MSPNENAQQQRAARHGRALLLAGLALAAIMAGLCALKPGPGLAPEQWAPARLDTYANLLLLGSTCCYLAHLWWSNAALGLWASWLGLFGALGLLGGLLLRAAEVYLLQRGVQLPLFSLDQVMALFSACTVLIYLVMERAYRTRAAGAFVMPIVAAAVLYQAWLSGNVRQGAAGTLPILRSYAVQAHVLSNFLGYGAFAVAAALASMVLLRARAERRGAGGIALRVLPPMAQCVRWMHLAIGFGFPLFTLGTLLGTRAAHAAWGRYWDWDPKECWALVVWSAYAGYFLLHYARRWRAPALAWWVLGAFGLAAFGFLGAHWYAGSLHAYV